MEATASGRRGGSLVISSVVRSGVALGSRHRRLVAVRRVPRFDITLLC
jgi:hypothetical protein